MRLRELLETTSEKTVAKTWDELTPKEKISGVKGRTVWNEKTRKYRTVFDVPAALDTEQGLAEAHLAGHLDVTGVLVGNHYDHGMLGPVKVSKVNGAESIVTAKSDGRAYKVATSTLRKRISTHTAAHNAYRFSESEFNELDPRRETVKTTPKVPFDNKYTTSTTMTDRELARRSAGWKDMDTHMADVARPKANEAEGDAKGVPHISKGLLQHIVKQVGTEGAHALVKSLEWGDGAAKELLQLLIRDLEKNISMAESTVESKIVSLEKKYNDIKGALGMARERRKAKGQHVQSPREMQLSTKMSQAYDLLCKAKQA